eukprot:COSAG02_NODE_16619_length_1070_cov_1.130793_1_plen_178_part_10
MVQLGSLCRSGSRLSHESRLISCCVAAVLKRIVFDPKPQLFPHKHSSTLRNAYNWAYGTIHSRGHSGQRAAAAKVDGTDLFAVIPFLDTMNHANFHAADATQPASGTPGAVSAGSCTYALMVTSSIWSGAKLVRCEAGSLPELVVKVAESCSLCRDGPDASSGAEASTDAEKASRPLQ